MGSSRLADGVVKKGLGHSAGKIVFEGQKKIQKWAFGGVFTLVLVWSFIAAYQRQQLTLTEKH